MTEHENFFHQPQPADLDSMDAPPSLLPSVLARLGLTGSRSGPATSLEALQAALSSPEWTTRVAALHELAGLHDPTSLALLFPALRDEDPSVRATAVRVLGTRGNLADPATFAHLETALHDSDWHVRATALRALNMEGTSLDPTSHLSEEYPYELPIHINNAKRKDAPMLEEKQLISTEQPPQTRPASQRPSHRHPRWRLVASALAAVLALSLITTWFVQIHISPGHPGSGPGGFSEAGALSLGAPLYTFQSNQPQTSQNNQPQTLQNDGGSLLRSPGDLSFGQWSADGRFYSSLQLNSQGNALQLHILNLTSGQMTIYPVLDSSWVPTQNRQGFSYSSFSFYLVGNDIVAFHARSANSAIMVIWDIKRQRQLANQILPASADQNGLFFYLPYIIPSQDGHKFVLSAPGRPLEIWDAARGQKLVTCQGLLSDSKDFVIDIEWYNNDQELLFFGDDGHLQAWSATTGNILFKQSDPTKTYYWLAISPDNKYLALEIGPHNAFRSGETRVESVEILDALTGTVVHTDPQVYMRNGANQFAWLPDSQHLRTVYAAANPDKEQIRVWDAFTGRDSLNILLPSPQFNEFTPDSRYLMLSNADRTSLELIQSSDGRTIATIPMPDHQPSLPLITNKAIILLQDHTLYVWSTSTGQLLYTYHGPMLDPDGRNQLMAISSSPDGRYLIMRASLSKPDTITATVYIWSLF